jgi:formate dehydrogenase beta subunit
VIVIGGGNVAVDVARTAARGGEQTNLQRNLSIVQAMDVARSAVRFGAREVTVCCLESESEMPASEEEVEQAALEGVRFIYRVGPKGIVGDGRSATAVEFLRVSRVFDANGRFDPKFIDGSEFRVATDTVIVAIGQTGDFSFLRPEDGVATGGGRILIDPDSLATTAPGIFSGGDAAFGPRIAIQAVANGKRAAKSIDTFLRGAARPDADEAVEVVLEHRWDRDLDFEAIPRQKPPSRPLERRIGIAEVEECFSEEAARREGTRCLRCWVNTIFEQQPRLGTECILCGGCQDICPENCIEIVPSRRVASLGPGARELAPIVVADARVGSIIVKNEEVCIRCGLCADRCPTGTITMRSFQRKENSVA